jgi:DNA polymerase
MFDNLDTTLAEMRRCVACDLREGRTQVVVPVGDFASRVMVVGHAPSGTDDASGIPYTGPAGEVLEELLFKAGLRRSQVWIANLVNCWAWKDQGTTRVNRPPTAGEVKTCTGLWLQREMQLIQPKAIVCLGGQTAQHFLGKTFKITESRGVWQDLSASSPYQKLFDAPPVVMAVLQPAYLIHLEQHAPEAVAPTREAMVTDWLEVKRVLEGGEVQRAAAG